MRIFQTVLLFSLCMFTSCKTDRELDQKEKSIDDVTIRTAMQIQDKYQGSICAWGGRAMHQVEKIAVSFKVKRSADIDEARKMIVDAVQIMENEINSDTNIRPYLIQYPYSVNGISLTFFFTDDNGHIWDFPQLAYVSASGGTISYERNEGGSMLRYEEILSETYEEALEKLNSCSSH